MKYCRSLLSIILLLTLLACSHDPVDTTGTISGIVKDAVTNANLQGAVVTLEGGSSIITGADGRYEFANVEMGAYKVSVSRTDYVSDEKTVLVKARQISNLDFSLFPAGSALEVSPTTLDFGTTDTRLGIDIKNIGQAVMQWQIGNDVEWLTCYPTSGSIISGRQASVTVSVDRTQLSRGTYNASFVVTSRDGGSQTVRVVVEVAGDNTSLPQVSMIGVDGVTDVAATFQGLIVSIGSSQVTQYGFCWSESRTPTLEQDRSCKLGSLSEAHEFSYIVSDLTPNTTYYVRAYATNAEGTVYSSYPERFTTQPTVGRPQVETGAVSQTTSTSAVVAGNILAIGHEDGIIQHGHVWSSDNKQPTTANTKTELGRMTRAGSFSSTLTALKPGTAYYVRAYATNAYGTNYGETERFTTAEGDIKLTTTAVSNISFDRATGGGRITDLQGNTIRERGICWAATANPTVAGSHAASADKTDAFTAQLTGLSENTTYHVRAYATAVTGKTFYGQDVEFTTTQDTHAPAVSATTVSAITISGATLKASVTSTGGGTITDAGFCYATTANPTTSGSKKSCGVQTASFSMTLSGLQPNTRYYVRAYAVNERGTSYGAQAEFTTSAITPPTLSAVSVSALTYKSAVFDAKVSSAGDGTIKRTGFCYATSHNPTTASTLLACGTASTLHATTSSLAPSTTYYVRAFAEYDNGVVYSAEASFTTKAKPSDTSIDLDDYDGDQQWDGK